MPSSESDNSELSYLWDGSDRDWVLFHLNPSEALENARFVIRNKRTKIALILEDDDEYEEVIARMKAGGVKIVTAAAL